MKYFIKYLPVEGEIKEGDDIVTVTGFIKKYKEDSLDVFQAPTKIKLFVCSRDIQTDDVEVYINKPDKTKTVKVKLIEILDDGDKTVLKVQNEEFGQFVSLKENAFKVIGEVSKGAIWVKEGDEFDEDQIQVNYAFPVRITYRNGEKKHNIILSYLPKTDEGKKEIAEDWADTSGNGSCYGYTIYWDEEPIHIHNVTLKCSQCNTFH
jgi:hypothetical protein